jgi:dinuclear metal center YbgI/SA1388 family protein
VSVGKSVGQSVGRPVGPVSLADVVTFIDGFLRTTDIPDYPNAFNGLEVENSGKIGRIIAAVDASMATIDASRESRAAGGSPLIIVHHGLFWDGPAPVTGRRYQRIRTLLAHDMALYGAHIPLDVHPEVGNNAVLARELGLTETSWFDDFKGVPIGVMGSLAAPREQLVSRLDHLLGCKARLIPGGPDVTRTVGVITGAAGNRIRAAKAAGCDTFVTGEGGHHTYFDAMEFGVNLIYAGHYATEQVGVKALAERVSREFGIPWEFFDNPTGL